MKYSLFSGIRRRQGTLLCPASPGLIGDHCRTIVRGKRGVRSPQALPPTVGCSGGQMV